MGIFKNLKLKLFDVTQHKLKQKFFIIEDAMLMLALGDLTHLLKLTKSDVLI